MALNTKHALLNHLTVVLGRLELAEVLASKMVCAEQCDIRDQIMFALDAARKMRNVLMYNDESIT